MIEIQNLFSLKIAKAYSYRLQNVKVVVIVCICGPLIFLVHPNPFCKEAMHQTYGMSVILRCPFVPEIINALIDMRGRPLPEKLESCHVLFCVKPNPKKTKPKNVCQVLCFLCFIFCIIWLSSVRSLIPNFISRSYSYNIDLLP
jgi:hypothetical protein